MRRLEALRTAYPKQDDLDIALMCCLDIANEYLQSRNDAERKNQHVEQRAKQVVAQLQQTLLDLQPPTAAEAEPAASEPESIVG